MNSSDELIKEALIDVEIGYAEYKFYIKMIENKNQKLMISEIPSQIRYYSGYKISKLNYPMISTTTDVLFHDPSLCDVLHALFGLITTYNDIIKLLIDLIKLKKESKIQKSEIIEGRKEIKSLHKEIAKSEELLDYIKNQIGNNND